MLKLTVEKLPSNHVVDFISYEDVHHIFIKKQNTGKRSLDPVHTLPEKFENAVLFLLPWSQIF